MARPEWLGPQSFYDKGGNYRESARAFLQEVFTENVEVQPSGCWFFRDSWPNIDQYRRFWWNGRTVVIHRFVYELWNGPIPDGGLVLHSCDVRPCCNPGHLRLGSQQENMADMYSRGRNHSGQADKTQCPQGHPYDEGNTNVYHGRRYCRECHRIYSLEWSRRNKEHKARTLREWRARQKAAMPT